MTSNRYLILHGFGNRRPKTHWQWWLTDQLRRRGEVVLYPQMPDPEVPVLESWLELLAAEWEQLGEAQRVVVCHSLACALWYQAAARGVLPEPADRVLWVAPAGASVLSRPEMAAFLPAEWCGDVLRRTSRTPVRLVASDKDPCCPEGPAEEVYGLPLGLEAETLPGVGHLTSADGFGPWPKVLEWCLDGETRFDGRTGRRGPAAKGRSGQRSSVATRNIQGRELLLALDRSRPRRVGRQLEDQLRGAIRKGTVGPGRELPSARVLAEDLKISRGTVMRAYAQLAAEGYLDVRQGATPRVRAIPITANCGRVLPSAGKSATPSSRSFAPPTFDLRADLPDVGLFPRALWMRSLRESLASATNAELADRDARGVEQLRVELAAYLQRTRGVVADADRLVITAGGLQALSAIARAFETSRSAIGIENPSALFLREVVLGAGKLPVPVPLDAEGLCVDKLADLRVAIVSSRSQFPTGIAMTPDRRDQWLEWLRGPDNLVIENDNDGDIGADRAAVPVLQSAFPDSVVYVGSTAKTLAPALRIGWAVLPPAMVKSVAAELAGGKPHPTPFDQIALADLLRRGEFDRYLRRMRTLYRRRRELILRALDEHLPDYRVSAVRAGMHVVLELPSPELEQVVVARARSAGFLLQCLSQHALPGYSGPAGILIGYGSLAEPTIATAVEQLADVIHAAPTRSAQRTAVCGPPRRTRARSWCSC